MSIRPISVLASPSDTGAGGNPYIDLLYEGLREQGVEVRSFDRRGLLQRPDVVHVHWPSALIRWHSGPQAVLDIVKVLGGLAIARRCGAGLIWTGHDLAPHEMKRRRLHAAYFWCFLRMVDLWISLTPEAARLLMQRYPYLRHRPMRVVAHGTYGDSYGSKPHRDEAERLLGLRVATGVRYLLLGQLRPYKNADSLIRSFLQNAGVGDRLIIAGEVRGDPGLGDRLIALAGDDPRVVLRLGRVPSEEIALWHAVADVVVLPYDTRSSLNSGAVMLALALTTPVVAVDSSINRELQERVGAAWVRLFRGGTDEALAEAQALAYHPPTGTPDMTEFAWDDVVRGTLDSYRLFASR